MSDRYIGSELELFAAAENWKRYIGRMLGCFVGGRVLEIGAGIGSNIRYLHSGRVHEWTSIEPDADLARRIEESLAQGLLPADCRVITGTIESVAATARFDTILYIDVLEHIAEDRAELAHARRHLAMAGRLVVLAPAHQLLFSPFDAAIGHHRRYGAASLRALTPPGSRLEACFMMDCAGFFASLANRVVLSAALPSTRQIAFWDRVLVPLSRILDPMTGRKFGKTVVAVWRAIA